MTCMHDFTLCLVFYFWWLYYCATDEIIMPHALYTVGQTRMLTMRPAVSLELWKSNLGAEFFFLSGQKEDNREEVMVTDDDKQEKYCLVSLAFACSDISSILEIRGDRKRCMVMNTSSCSWLGPLPVEPLHYHLCEECTCIISHVLHSHVKQPQGRTKPALKTRS